MGSRFAVATVLCLFLALPTVHAGVGETLLPGDMNCDEHVDISDAIFLLSYLYLGAGPPCSHADRPQLLERVADLEGTVAALQAQLAVKIAALAGCEEALAAQETNLRAEFAAREAELLAMVAAKDAEATAAAGQLAACEAELEEWKSNGFEECRNRLDRFTRNGDGTLTDTCTGLMWQQTVPDLNSDGVFNLGADNRFPVDKADWNGAKAYAEGLVLAGHDDWRLPEIEEIAALRQDELVMLISPFAGCFPPAFNVPLTCCNPPGADVAYWSATPYDVVGPDSSGPLAWFVRCTRPGANERSLFVLDANLYSASYLVLAVRGPIR